MASTATIHVLRFLMLVSVGFATPTGRSTIGPEVLTSNGGIQGFTQTVEDVLVNTFLGVPYAVPPVGEFRFAPPIPTPNRTETLQTTSQHSACPQMLYNYFPNNPGEAIWNPHNNMSEDCLYLNVWVPVSSATRQIPSNLTTMLWIFGGGFVSGSASLDLYDGKILAALNQVIVVSINYRVGPLGFLYLSSSDAPGNMGLMDQQLALKWVHENIENFGGDRNKISLFGESAGAASVHFHMINEESRDYFQTAILQSGSSLAPWAFKSSQDAYRTSIELAEHVGCEQTSAAELITCLRGIPDDILVSTQWQLALSWTFTTSPFVPTVDGNFIKEDPSISVSSGRVARKPLLLGVDKNEETYWIMYGLLGQVNHETGHLDKDSFESNIALCVDPLMSDVVKESIKHEYDNHFPTSSRPPLMTILDDIGRHFSLFVYPISRLTRL